jgi:4-amino-4-deoxy-L-arabinose transferase-like glycosyltransferase
LLYREVLTVSIPSQECDMYTMQSAAVKRVCKYVLLLVFIIFRCVLLYSNLDWNGDSARDQIYAKLILANPEYIYLGHWNSGIGMHYPPYYYYILAFIRSAYDSYGAVLCIHILLNFLAILALYKITKLVSSTHEGFLVVCLCLISPVMISISSSVWSPYFSVPLGIIVLYFGQIS